MLATGFYTGMRRGGILGLTWDKVDLRAKVVKLEATDTKDRQARTIPVCQELSEVFSQIPQALHDRHVFLY